MKNVITASIVLSLLALMLLACAPEASVESSTPSTATIPATELTDEQLLQVHPDYLNEALQELEEVE